MALFDFHFDLGQWSFPGFRRRPKTILIVEDDPLTIRLIQRAAETEGYAVEVATTAEEALGILHANGKRFVLAMLDVKLPSMDGWTLRNRILDSWPKLRVVVMSGAPESFIAMPTGECLTVLIKPPNYGDFFRDLK